MTLLFQLLTLTYIFLIHIFFLLHFCVFFLWLFIIFVEEEKKMSIDSWFYSFILANVLRLRCLLSFFQPQQLNSEKYCDEWRKNLFFRAENVWNPFQAMQSKVKIMKVAEYSKYFEIIHWNKNNLLQNNFRDNFIIWWQNDSFLLNLS